MPYTYILTETTACIIPESEYDKYSTLVKSHVSVEVENNKYREVGSFIYYAKIEYTTGNTFGRDDELRYEYVITDTLEDAKKFKLHERDEGYEQFTTVALRNGTEGSLYCCGYFESIERAFLYRVQVVCPSTLTQEFVGRIA